MGPTLNIRHPRAHELARELADRRKTGLTEVVIDALENELRRERERGTLAERLLGTAGSTRAQSGSKQDAPLVERLERIAERARAKAGPNGRQVSEAERDEMWTRC